MNMLVDMVIDKKIFHYKQSKWHKSLQIIFEDENKISFEEFINEQKQIQLNINIKKFKRELSEKKLSKNMNTKLNNYIKNIIYHVILKN